MVLGKGKKYRILNLQKIIRSIRKVTTEKRKIAKSDLENLQHQAT